MRVQICTPTYIEAENIEEFLRRARAAMPEADILVLDDNSPDGTADIADRVGAELGHIEVLRRPEKRGLGNAYRAGFAIGIARGYDVLCQIDADLSHDPARLPDLLAAAERADVVLGSRYVPGGGVSDWGLARRLLSRGGCAYARLILGAPVRDLTGGYKVLHRHVLEAIDLDSVRSQGYVFQIEVTYRALLAGFRVVEVPITFRERDAGASKMSLRIALEAMWRVPLLRRSAPAALARARAAAARADTAPSPSRTA